MNPWKRARTESIRAEVNRRACDQAVAEVARISKENAALQRLLKQAEDVIRDQQRLARDADATRLRVELAIARDVNRALEDRLEAAREAEAYCERHHGPLVRVQQMVERDEGAA